MIHTLLWYINDDPKLSNFVISEINQLEKVIGVSIVSLWEIAVKVNLNIEGDIYQIKEDIEKLNFQIIPISLQALNHYISLPNHHKDPFDRLLISQAKSGGIPIINKDIQFDHYDVHRIWD